MTRSLPLASVIALSLLPAVAHADSFETLDGGSGTASDVAHSINLTVEPGLAVLRVERTILVTGGAKSNVLLHLQLPLNGVVTGLSVQGKGEAEIQKVDHDTVVYFPDVKGSSKRRISYRIEVPLVAKDDTAQVWLPQASSSGGTLVPVVRLGGEVLLPEDNPGWDPVRVPQPTPASGRARWGKVAAGNGWIWRTEVDAPHSFGESIDEASIVFLLDVSRSQARKGIDRQLRLLHEWARQVPRARYQVIAYHRDADLVFPSWKSADGIRDLGAGHAKLVLHNGSNLDGALELAASVLSKTEGRSMVIIASDGETPVASDPKAMSSRLSGLGDDTVAHLILTSGRHTSGAIETRADSHRLGRIAMEHDGVPVHVYLPDSWPTPPEEVALQNLLRPTRVDRYDTLIDGNPHEGDQAGRRLYEHQGVVSMGYAKSEPKTVLPTGLRWGKQWQTRPVRTAAVDRRAAIFAGTDISIDSDDLADLGRKFKFVTAGTALKSNRSGTSVVAPRPLESGGGIGLVGASTRDDKPSPGELSADAVRTLFVSMYQPCIDSFRGPGGTVQLSLEMSWNEILDVSAIGGDTATNLCIEEAIWAADLPDDFKHAHAFGMVEEPLPRTESSDDDDDADDGPPETEASRSGGCSVDGRSLPAWGWWMLVALAVGYRRRGRAL